MTAVSFVLTALLYHQLSDIYILIVSLNSDIANKHFDTPNVDSDTVNFNSDVVNTDFDTPVMNSDTPRLHSDTLNLDSDHEALISDKVRYKSDCLIGKSDTTFDSDDVMANSDIVRG